MNQSTRSTVLTLVIGCVLGAGITFLSPQQELKATSAHGNDKFSMCTVPITTLAETDAVFVLDHLTGVLRGGYLNSGTGGFSHGYVRNVALDFAVNPATPEPKYVIVSGPAQMRASGGTPPANGLLYIGELTSGKVIAYSFARPAGRGAAAMLEVRPVDAFLFREAVGG